MPKATIQDKIVKALSNDERFTRDYHAKTEKYVVFSIKDKPTNLYVGRKGAVRIGKTATGSIPVSDNTISQWVEIGSEILSRK
jgi:hypothetical protein